MDGLGVVGAAAAARAGLARTHGIGLGTMLGGIFPTIGAGAHAAGPAVILAYVVSGLVSLCVALCYAEFASMVPGCRQRVHLRVRNARRAGRVDHRLGSDLRIRPVARADGLVALRLFPAHARERRHRVSRVGADRQRARGAPADRSFRLPRDAGRGAPRSCRHSRVGRRQRRARGAADRLDDRLHRRGGARGARREPARRSRRSAITACSRAPRWSFLRTSASIR